MFRPSDLKGAKQAGELLAHAIRSGQRVCIVADYDCDGACACAIMLRGMKILGANSAQLSYLVPDRQVDGYGLTPVIVQRAKERYAPDILVTVDNGIASFEGVALARELGLAIIVTDHHLPAQVAGEFSLPDATVIVNPSQPGCAFVSKALCGAGVAFYVMLMTRSALREMGAFDAVSQPRMDFLLELVALATVADVVKLDENNRRLVSHGLDRIRSSAGNPGIQALFAISGRKAQTATAQDLAFSIGPRINAAGRLSDMTLGIECLLADAPQHAEELAGMLHQINQARRQVQSDMQGDADGILGAVSTVAEAIVVFSESFHEGVVGIISGKIKESQHRPTFVFALAHDGHLKGSGRSIPGFHLRDALDLISKRHPDLILRFGGHAMAAGCTIRRDGEEAFRQALCTIAREWLSQDMLEQTVMTDGPLAAEDYNVPTVKGLNGVVWGQGFDTPIFVDQVCLLEQRIVGQKHLKLMLSVAGQRREGIWFGRTDPLESDIRLAYRVDVNQWMGRESLQMLIEGIVAPS